MVSFGDISGIAMSVGFGLLIMAAIVIAISAFKSSATTGNYTVASTILGNTETFFTNFTGQLGTVGTISGIMLLVGVVIVGFGYGYSKYKGGM